MSRLEVRAMTLNDGRAYVYYVAFDDTDQPNDAVNATILDLVKMAHWRGDSLNKLVELVLRAQSGAYQSPNPGLPDFGINDVNIWLAEPNARPGMICVTNENTEYTHEFGRQQHFTFNDFWSLLKCFTELSTAIRDTPAELLITDHVSVAWLPSPAPNNSFKPKPLRGPA